MGALRATAAHSDGENYFCSVSCSTASYPLPFSDHQGAIVTGLVFAMAFFGIVANVITIFVINGSPRLRYGVV